MLKNIKNLFKIRIMQHHVILNILYTKYCNYYELTEEKVNKLKELWKGQTASQISRIGGVSRNAVIGKAHS